MATVAEAGMLKRLDDAHDGVVVGGCSELVVDAAEAAGLGRVVEVAVDVGAPRLAAEVAAVGQLDGPTEGRGSVNTTGEPLRRAGGLGGGTLRHCRCPRRRVRRLLDVVSRLLGVPTRRRVAAGEYRQKILRTLVTMNDRFQQTGFRKQKPQCCQ